MRNAVDRVRQAKLAGAVGWTITKRPTRSCVFAQTDGACDASVEPIVEADRAVFADCARPSLADAGEGWLGALEDGGALFSVPALLACHRVARGFDAAVVVTVVVVVVVVTERPFLFLSFFFFLFFFIFYFFLFLFSEFSTTSSAT